MIEVIAQLQLRFCFLYFQAHESLEEAKSMFEEINNELHRELPKFYDYRVEFIANNLIKFFTAEGTLHNNTGKVSC